MISFVQRSGRLFLDGRELCRFPVSYSGHGDGLNNPAIEALHGVGVIPAGQWIVGRWHDHPHLGPVVAELTPRPCGGSIAWAHGRSGFFVHGDNAKLDHSASDGCIIAPRWVRAMLRDSGETILEVVHYNP